MCFDHQIVKFHGQLLTWVEKKTTVKFRPKFLESRRMGLQYFLKYVHFLNNVNLSAGRDSHTECKMKRMC